VQSEGGEAVQGNAVWRRLQRVLCRWADAFPAAFGDSELRFGIQALLCALAGALVGYVAGFYLGSLAADRSFPPGGNAGDGLGAILIAFSIIAFFTLLGLVGGIWGAFALRRRKCEPLAKIPISKAEPPSA
jgi:hypothetical protein